MRKTDEEKLLFLEALEEAGVDNWEGYDEAVEIYQQKLKTARMKRRTICTRLYKEPTMRMILMNDVEMDGYSVMEDDIDTKVYEGEAMSETSVLDVTGSITGEMEDGAFNELVDSLSNEYPITLDFDPVSLSMESYAGKVRKTRCWKTIISDNRKILSEFITYIKEEFPATLKIRISYDVLEYLKDKLLREDIQGGMLAFDESLDRNTIVLVKE